MKKLLTLTLILAMLASAAACGKAKSAEGSGAESGSEGSIETSEGESSDEMSKNTKNSDTSKSTYVPSEDLSIGWYDTGLKCPLTTVKWKNKTEAQGVKYIYYSDKQITAPENGYYKDGSMFGQCNQTVGDFKKFRDEDQDDIEVIWSMKVYKNGNEVPDNEYVDESMVYRVFDGRDGSITEHRICLSLYYNDEMNNFVHETYTSERLFKVSATTVIENLKYFENYKKYGFEVNVLKGGNKTATGKFSENMVVRISKNNGAVFWDYKVVIDENYVSELYSTYK